MCLRLLNGIPLDSHVTYSAALIVARSLQRAARMTKTHPYRMEQDRRRTTVTLLPEMNETPWSDIELIGTEVVQRLQAVPAPSLLVDLSPLNYMGSAQVALVVRLFKVVKERHGKMVVVARDPLVREVLTLAGLDKLWVITDDLNDALAELGWGSPIAAATSRWLGALGSVCVAVSVAGLVAVLTKAAWLPLPMATWLQFGAAGVAFCLGLAGGLMGAGPNRTLGVGVVASSLALLLASVFLLGAMTAPADRGAGSFSPAPANSPAANSPAAGQPEPAKPAANKPAANGYNSVPSARDAAPADSPNPAQP
jgi:anti-anti-sigma factor